MGGTCWNHFREDPDPRLRASIVEYLWTSAEPVARLVFEEALRDPQPRVRANGLVGLYRLGDPRALAGLARMAGSPQALHRAVARWAMEVIQDPRLEPLLAKLQTEPGHSAGQREPGYAGQKAGKRRLRLWVVRMDWTAAQKLRTFVSIRQVDVEPLAPGLRPLDLRAWVDGAPVLEYTVSRPPPPERLAVGLVLPLSLRAASERTPGIRESLDQLMTLPDGEWRAVGFYRSGLFTRNTDSRPAPGSADGAVEPETAPVRAPVFLPDGVRLAADLKNSTQEDNLASEPGDLVLAMLKRLRALHSTGHVGVVLDEALQGPPRAAVQRRDPAMRRRVPFSGRCTFSPSATSMRRGLSPGSPSAANVAASGSVSGPRRTCPRRPCATGYSASGNFMCSNSMRPHPPRNCAWKPCTPSAQAK